MRPSIACAFATCALAACGFTAPSSGLPDAPFTDAPVQPDMVLTEQPSQPRIVDDHLVGLWRFDEGTGATARDTVAEVRDDYAATPMNFELESGAASWVPGGLRIAGPSVIRTRPGRDFRPHVTPEVNASGEVTLELWVTPDPSNTPDATLFTLGSGQPNCSLRVQRVADRYVGCAKEDRTMTERGPERPIRSSNTAGSHLQHIVLVAGPTARAIYVDGIPTDAPAADRGALRGWNEVFRISLGAELNTASVPSSIWTGTLWFAALYDRVLTPDEIAANRSAGHECTGC